MRIQIINGPNINLLGKREPSIYGSSTFEDCLAGLKSRYPDVSFDYFQSNIEGELIDKIQEVGFDVDGIVLNAGAYTHTSIALQDAIRAITAPVIEVHISNVHARESFRHVSMIACACRGVICGFGLDSYRLAVVTIKKQYAGHAKRVMMGVWSFLRQFMYTKFVIVCDDDVNARDWNDVIWAITTRMDPARDTVLVENTPIDYLDFASPVSGLGSKMGLDATNKWPGETQREWGRPIKKDPDVVAHIDAIWDELAIFNNGKSA